MSNESTSVYTGSSERVSHYQVLSVIGSGGMGIVYKAEDLRLKRLVALKFLPPELTRNEAAKTRFLREAQTASSLDHPNICSIHEIDETPDGRHFICMAYYEGETFASRLKNGPPPINEAIQIVSKVADGLATAHAHDIIHRDIKPANLMLTSNGEVKIMDFGLAKLRDATRITRLGTTIGTCAYMSPEQVRGDEVDERSDIFSLGVVLYELLTGKPPFCAENEAAVLYQVTHSDPRPAAELRPGLTQPLQQILSKALQKDVANRYQTVSELREDLQSVASGAKPAWARLPHRYFRPAAAMMLLVGITAAILLWPSTSLTTPTSMHVAVLPFVNLGSDSGNQAFCDGLMETLSTQLTQLEQYRASLWVVPASVVRAQKVGTPAEARKALGANLVITGAVQRFAQTIRVTLNLVDVSLDTAPRQLSSAMIDNEINRMAALQDQAVLRLAQMLNMSELPKDQTMILAGVTTTSAAYDFYLQGLGYVRSYEDPSNLEKAIEAFSMAVKADDAYALAYAGLGEAYWRKYRESRDPQWIETALTHARRAVEVDSLVAQAHVTLGLILSGTEHPESSLREFERALALEPMSVEAQRGLATAYADMQDFAKADATYQRAIDMKPDYWGGYNDFGIYLFKRGEYRRAIAQFHSVTELNPHNVYAYNNLGACYWRSDQLDEAREMFERSLEAAPNYRAYSNLGAVLYRKGDYARAAEMTAEALNLNNTDYTIWANLGNSYYWMPKRELALSAYRQSVDLAEKQRKLTPRDSRLLASLAGYYAVLGAREQALSTIYEALEIDPSNATVLYFVGHAHEQLQQREEALEWIGKALDGGYSLSEVEDDPFLELLRQDERFALLRERGVRARQEQEKQG